MSAISQYISDSLAEFHQVRWPTRQQAIRLSIVVVTFILLSSLFLGLMDYVIGRIISVILNLS